MYSFRKSKKGFTLIELMVVVVIIGVLALLGLRLYLTQIGKSDDAMAKANAGTVQTTIQGNLADEEASALAGRWIDQGLSGSLIDETGIHNPMTKLIQATAPNQEFGADATECQVWVYFDDSNSVFHINAKNHKNTANVYTTDLVAKY